MSCVEQHSKANKKKILVVDDHPLIREGLTDLINKEKDILVCGCAKDIPQAMRAIKKLEPDIVTVDISLESESGLDLINDIKVCFPDLPILVLSMHQESFYAELAIKAGAKGYITKGEGTKKVIAALREILDGKLYLSEKIKEKLLHRLIGSGKLNTHSLPIDCLTNREMEVFALLGQGKSTCQMAEQLHLSMKTVETYRSRIKEKLNIASNPKLLRYAFQWANNKHA